jgi:hypothetical protein
MELLVSGVSVFNNFIPTFRKRGKFTLVNNIVTKHLSIKKFPNKGNSYKQS